MTDDAKNGDARQAEAEQFAEQAAHVVAAQTRELLGLLGFAVTDEAGLLEGARTQLQAQAAMSQQIPPAFQLQDQVEKHPFFSATFTPARAPSIIMANAPPIQGFRITGPKRVKPGIDPAWIVGALISLDFATNPVLRLACVALGLRVNFEQTGAPQPPKPKLYRGPARS